MGLIKEPLDVDFYVDPRPLTDEERGMISEHIKQYKAKMAQQRKPRLLHERKQLITSK